MWFTVEDVLAMEIMQEASVIAGHDGIGRSVKAVTVLDAPDASLWLQGQEFVLTSTFPLTKRGSSLKKLVDELVSRNVAGLGVKLHRYMTALPPAMLDRANELAFPIIRIPDHIAWIQIISPILAHVMDTDAKHVIRSEEVRNQFFQQVLAGAKIEQMLELLQKLLNRPVGMYSPEDAQSISVPPEIRWMDTGHAVVNNPNLPSRPVAEHPKLLRKASREHSVVYTSLDQPATAHAYVAVLEGNTALSQHELHTLRHARDAISMSLLQQRASRSVAREKHNEFVQTLVDGSLSVNARRTHVLRGRERGIPLHEQYFAIVIKFYDLDEYSLRAAMSLFHGKLETEHVLFSSLDRTRFLLLVPDQGNNGRAHDERISLVYRYIDEVSRIQKDLDWSAGVSQATSIHVINRAHEQAEYALNYSIRSGQKCQVRLHDETGLYRLLSHAAIQDDAQHFIEDWLAPLLEYDRKHQSRLVQTLRHFLHYNGNYRETARALHVHHNTVRYRIGKIYSLTGKDILASNLRLQYQLALVLHDMAENAIPHLERY